MARSLLGRIADSFAPTNLATPVPFSRRHSYTGTGHEGGSRYDMGAQLRSMGSVGTLFAIVDKLSNSTASVEWELWRKAPSGKPEDRVQVTSHAALDLWNKANDFMAGQLYVEIFQQHLELTGEAYWVIVRGMGIPLEMWPVKPSRMTPNPHPTEYLIGWIYTAPDGQKIPLGIDEVIQLRKPDPDNSYRGMSPVQALLRDIESSRHAAEYTRNFFVNGAMPGGLIEFPVALDDPAYERFRDRWAEQHQGVRNAHRVALIEHGGKWIDRKFTMADMQLSELRKLSSEAIREAYGFPKAMLGTVDDVNRANAEAGAAMYKEELIVPRSDRIKGALNHRLLPMFGDTAIDLEFDYASPVPANREADNAERTSKAGAYLALIKAGADPEDAAAAVGLPILRNNGLPQAFPGERAGVQDRLTRGNVTVGSDG